ncbi:MAG: hypothetical protein IPJ62_00495 [Betaproteobacteria bacterium]|nr:hypothetical protein [Betaproteobacteria bacterium]
MNATTKQWESYVDDAGRRHWRWPATTRPGGPAPGPQGQPQRALPRQQQAQLLPLHVRSR